MEIRQIPDYPNYGVTRDGRVWSYNINRFMKPYSKPQVGNIIYLWVEGIKFYKLVRRLVFEAFTGDTPEYLIQKDGDLFNDNLENLKPVNRSKLGAIAAKKRKNSVPEICRIDIATRKMDFIKVHRKDKSYTRIHLAVRRHFITSGGCFYYLPGEKELLIEEIKARIRSNQLSIENLMLRDKYSPYIRVIKKHIEKHKEYLEILEGV